MKSITYKASSRGHKAHGWLDTYHTFSFADYYNPERMNFGALRVVNDDVIDAGEGFGKHPHDNMEIVSIPLSGELQHVDSMGHKSVIRSGEIQVMSAGSGIFHSEFNPSLDKKTNLLQIWIFPSKKNIEPRYDQKSFDPVQNKLVEIISPNSDSKALKLHQDTWFNIGIFDKGHQTSYQIQKHENGVFAMVIEGKFSINNNILQHRDAIGIWDTDSIKLEALTDKSQILLIEVPMLF